MAADTSVTQFCYERVNSSLKELMNIKVFLSNTTLHSRLQNLKKKSLFNIHDNSLGPLPQLINTVSPKRLEIEEYSISKQRALLR